MSMACAMLYCMFSVLFNIDLHKITKYLPDGEIYVGLLDPQQGLQSAASGQQSLQSAAMQGAVIRFAT
jgi:hypothetical protein